MSYAESPLFDKIFLSLLNNYSTSSTSGCNFVEAPHEFVKHKLSAVGVVELAHFELMVSLVAANTPFFTVVDVTDIVFLVVGNE